MIDSVDRSNPVLATLRAATVLRSCALFAPLPAVDVVLLAEIATHVSLPPGVELFEYGAEPDGLYVVASGSVVVRQRGAVRATLAAGECVGLVSVLDASPRCASAGSASDGEGATLVRLDRDDVWDVLTEQPALARAWRNELARRTRATLAAPAASPRP